MKTKAFTEKMRKAFFKLNHVCLDSVSIDDYTEKLGDACRACGIRTDAVPVPRILQAQTRFDNLPRINLKDVLRKRADLTLYWMFWHREVVAVYAKNERDFLKKITCVTAKVKATNP
jgi:hypothetical protein